VRPGATLLGKTWQSVSLQVLREASREAAAALVLRESGTGIRSSPKVLLGCDNLSSAQIVLKEELQARHFDGTLKSVKRRTHIGEPSAPNPEHSSWPRSTSTLTSKPPRLIAGRDPGSGRPRSLRVLLRNSSVWTACREKPIREVGRLDRIRICRACAATWARAINGHPERENGHYEQDG
jgi:hypothetical protein